ncbi:MAG: MarR family transcriptional regulator [Thermoleophilaceae bacterium]|nr:MarR family transcriptional regulator [Thermoleophilaceae bacterium]
MSAVTSAEPALLLTPGELGAWRGLLRVHAAMTKALDAELVREHGLPLSSYEVLLFLADAPGGRLRMSDLADGVLLSRSGLTRLVDRMERDGLLRRVRCADDARGYHAAITDKGRTLFGQVRRTHLDGVRERFLSRLSPDELRTLAELWEKVAPGAAG